MGSQFYRLIVALSLSVLACVAPAALAVPAQPTATAAPTATATPETYTTTGTVYIRDAAGDVLDCTERMCYYSRGQAVQCAVEGDWCWLDADRRVWRGCLAGQEDLGCRPR